MAKTQLLRTYAEAYELDGGGYICKRRATLGRDEIYLHASLQPLERAVGDQMAFDFSESDMPCDTGYCFI